MDSKTVRSKHKDLDELIKTTTTGRIAGMLAEPIQGAGGCITQIPTEFCGNGEYFFGYMMQHYDIEGLVQYGGEETPGTVEVVNPAWRTLDKTVANTSRRIRKLHAELGAASPPGNHCAVDL